METRGRQGRGTAEQKFVAAKKEAHAKREGLRMAWFHPAALAGMGSKQYRRRAKQWMMDTHL